MNQQQLDDIRARVEATSPPPWNAKTNADGQLVIEIVDPAQSAVLWCGDMETCTGRDLHNHQFIASSPQDVRALLDEVARLQAENERVGNLYNAALIERDDLREALQWYADTSNYTPEGIRRTANPTARRLRSGAGG